MTEIITNFILQISGKPKENVFKALEKIVDQIKQHNKYDVLNVDILEPSFDEKTKLFSGVIDIKIRFDTIQYLLEFVYDYMPISIEIEEPSKLNIQAADLNNILNDISMKLLEYLTQVNHLNFYIKNELNKNK